MNCLPRSASAATSWASISSAITSAEVRLASDLGDEHAATGMTVGRIAGAKKGDGVLRIGGSAAAVVLEMTDSDAGRAWGPYLDEAERNRGAAASLGLVRTLSQNGGRMIRVPGPRRMMLTFDVRTDDLELLRTVLLLLRAIAQAAVSRHGVAELATAGERLAEALGEPLRIDKVRRSAALIRKNADTIERECDSLQLSVRRLVVQAREALATADGGPVADGITLDPAG